MNVSGNKLTLLENIKLKKLRKLNVSENEIKDATNFEGHATLEYLDMHLNKLQNLAGLKNMPNLLELNCEENEITNFRDLDNLPKLKRLLLGKNKMKKIRTPLPILPSLFHLSIADN